MNIVFGWKIKKNFINITIVVNWKFQKVQIISLFCRKKTQKNLTLQTWILPTMSKTTILVLVSFLVIVTCCLFDQPFLCSLDGKHRSPMGTSFCFIEKRAKRSVPQIFHYVVSIPIVHTYWRTIKKIVNENKFSESYSSLTEFARDLSIVCVKKCKVTISSNKQLFYPSLPS